MRKHSSPGVREQIEAINRSSSRTAEELRQCGVRSGVTDIVFGPLVVFLRSSIVRGRVFRGVAGSVRSGLEAYEHFVTRLKLWELHNADRDAGRR